jgi:CheY-like chemotaxis protein/signal transduction histidine kinase
VNILVVDDIPINRKLLRAMLEAEGHATLEAADGVEALQLLGREKMDGMVSDILMPRMDGYRLCHEVRKDSRLRDLPIVIYSATYLSQSDEKLALDMGADKFLKKPSSVGSIVAALKEAVVTQHTAPQSAGSQEVEVLKEYSDRLVSKLEEKNIELEESLRLTVLSMDVTTALMQGDTLQEILQRCSEALVLHLDAAFAGIWTLRDGESTLELQASAGTCADSDGPPYRVPVGQPIIGRIASERRPHSTNFVLGDPSIREQEWARREGLVAFAGHPLILEDRLLGVVAVFARFVLSSKVLDKMPAIADAVALGIGRKQVAEELRAVHGELAEANQRLTILDRSKSEFLNLISHELRTPLNGLFGVGELILDQMPSTGGNIELHGMFERSRRRILSIVDDALLLTQIDVSREQFRSGQASLSVVLNRAIEGTVSFAEPRYVMLGPAPERLGLVVGDEDLLTRAFQALLETAVKFSEKGEIVRLSSELRPDSLGVIIETHGRTIPGPALGKFFELFSISGAITPGGDLGLAAPVAARILALFGASVRVTNREPPGIRLTISLRDAARQFTPHAGHPPLTSVISV